MSSKSTTLRSLSAAWYSSKTRETSDEAPGSVAYVAASMRAFLAALITLCTSPGVKPRLIPLATFSFDGRTCQGGTAGKASAATPAWAGGLAARATTHAHAASLRRGSARGRRVRAHRNAERGHTLSHNLEGVVGVVDGEATSIGQPVRLQPVDVTSKHREGERVEGPHGHRVGGGRAEQTCQTLSQLARRLVGECDLVAWVVVLAGRVP